MQLTEPPTPAEHIKPVPHTPAKHNKPEPPTPAECNETVASIFTAEYSTFKAIPCVPVSN